MPRGREVGRRHELDQLVDRAVRVARAAQAGVDHLAEVVRRDVGRHADRDARGAVDQQVRHARRQHRRLELLAVVVRREVDRLLVDVGEQLGGDLLQPALGVAVGRGRVAVDRAEVALAVDQRVAHREVLRHAHQRLVGRGVAVRVVLAEHVADDARALHVGPVPDVVGFVHREQHAAVHRFQAVAHVRQRASDDHAHGVIEVGAPHLLFEGDRAAFLWRIVPSGEAPNFIMQASVFPLKNACPAALRLCLNRPRFRTQKRGGK